MPIGGNFVSCSCCGQGEACESRTTALSTAPLCLGDGTPIAVVVTRDCDGNVTQDGYLDLTTGEYVEGAPPEGAGPCAGGQVESPGDVSPGQPVPPRPEYELARWCDLDEAGEVIAPVLVEYKYGPTGALEDVRTLTPDGQPYTVQGQLGVCDTLPEESPSEESPGTPCVHCQTIPMCDTTVEDVSPGEGTEIPWSVVSVDPDPESEPGYGYLFTLSPDDDPSQRAVVRVTSGKQANTVCPPQNPGDIVFNNTNDLRFELDPVAQTASYLRVDLLDFDTFEPVQIHSDSPEPTRLGGTATWDPEHTRIVPTTSNGTGEMYWDNPPTSFGYRIWNTGGGNSCSQLSFAMVTIDPPVPPPGSEVSTSFLRSICRDCDGAVISTTDTELDGATPYTVQGRATVCGNTAPAPVDPESPGSPGGQADIVDCEDGGRALLVKLCDTGSPGDESPAEPCRHCQTFVLCDTPEESPEESPGDLEPVQFMRTICRGCDGEIVSTTDETLDGEPYTVTGTVGVCAPPPAQPVDPDSPGEPEPCRNTTTILLCDERTLEDESGTLDATPIDSAPFNVWRGYGEPPGEWCQDQGDNGTFWTGGSTQFTPDASCTEREGRHVVIAASLATLTNCAEATATVSVRVTNNGPAAGFVSDGGVALWNTRTEQKIAEQRVTNDAPAGHQETITLTAEMSGTDLATGNLALSIDLETNHQGAKTWTVDQFTTFYEGRDCTETTEFLRHTVVDCETGEVISQRDTTLDGEPYTPTGEVGHCTQASDCCPTEPSPALTDCEDGPALRVVVCEPGSPGDVSPGAEPVDVEPVVLCVNDTEAGKSIRTVVAEYVYNATGQRVEARYVDPETGEPVTLGAGEEIGECCEDCPRSFSTECVAAVEAEVTYDNTTVINGVAGDCGRVSGPNPGPNWGGPAFVCSGTYQVTSWIIDGEEVVTNPVQFTGEHCGPNDESGQGMHQSWAAVLTTLDGNPWEARNKPGCAWYVGTAMRGERDYGDMVVELVQLGDNAGNPDLQPGDTWTLGPVEFCSETPYTRVFTQECDGSVSLSYLDSAGNLVDPPSQNLQPCGTCTGRAGNQADVVECDEGQAMLVKVCGGDESPAEPVLEGEPRQLCDVQDDGSLTRFLRHYTYDSSGQPVSYQDTTYDLTPYTPTGTVDSCEGTEQCGTDGNSFGSLPAPGGDPTVDGEVYDTNPAPYIGTMVHPNIGAEWAAGDGQALWDGGQFTLGPDTSAGPGSFGDMDPQHFRVVAARMYAPEPSCSSGKAGVFVQVRVTNQGPAGGNQQVGGLIIGNHRTQKVLATDWVDRDPPVGHSQVLSALVEVDADDLINANIVIILSVETWHNNAGTEWLAEDFFAIWEYDTTGCIDRRPSMAVELCSPITTIAGTDRQIVEVERCDDLDADGVPDTTYTEYWGVDPTGSENPILVGTYQGSLDQPYIPVAPVPCPAGAGAGAGVMVATGAQRLGASDSVDVPSVAPGLQSATVTVVAGEATVTTDDGAVQVPAGVSLTWSVARDFDTTLSTLQVEAAPSSDALVTWTRLS